MKNLKCFFLGHRPSETTDCGYQICERCNAHEYYDGPDNNRFWYFGTLPTIAIGWWWWFRWAVVYRVSKKIRTKCRDCGKSDSVFGKYTGDHSNCLPF